MKLDPGERPTAAQALGHPFLKEVLKGRELLHARDHYDSESISDKTSTTESTAGVVEKSVAAEPDLSVMLSCRNIETENQKRSVDSEFKAPGDNLTDVKEEDAGVAPHIFFNKVSPKSTDVEDEPLSSEDRASDCHRHVKESSLMREEYYCSMNKTFFKKKLSMEGTKEWLNKKINQVFRKKEQQYEEFAEDSD